LVPSSFHQPSARLFAPPTHPAPWPPVRQASQVRPNPCSKACMAWYDQDYARVDLNGFVCFNSTQVPLKQGACIYRHCPTDFPPKPRRWDEMLATARKLGAGLGVHMRLDFFPGEHGVVLGEFTPWHTNGKVHCDSRNILVPGEVHPRVDYCTLGKRWKRYRPSDDNERLGSFEGGWLPPHTQTTPPAIEGWQSFAFDDSQKCELARKHLRPASWASRKGVTVPFRGASKHKRGRGGRSRGASGADRQRGHKGSRGSAYGGFVGSSSTRGG